MGDILVRCVQSWMKFGLLYVFWHGSEGYSTPPGLLPSPLGSLVVTGLEMDAHRNKDWGALGWNWAALWQREIGKSGLGLLV